jgi:hypothetical protein
MTMIDFWPEGTVLSHCKMQGTSGLIGAICNVLIAACSTIVSWRRPDGKARRILPFPTKDSAGRGLTVFRLAAGILGRNQSLVNHKMADFFGLV